MAIYFQFFYPSFFLAKYIKYCYHSTNCQMNRNPADAIYFINVLIRICPFQHNSISASFGHLYESLQCADHILDVVHCFWSPFCSSWLQVHVFYALYFYTERISIYLYDQISVLIVTFMTNCWCRFVWLTILKFRLPTTTSGSIFIHCKDFKRCLYNFTSLYLTIVEIESICLEVFLLWYFAIINKNPNVFKNKTVLLLPKGKYDFHIQ